MSKQYKYLTDDQVHQFITKGYIRISQAFTEAQAHEFTKDVWVRLGVDENDKSTWDKEREWINMPSFREYLTADFAPKAWGAICELVGGEDRIEPSKRYWNDAMIVNLGKDEYENQTPPHPKELDRWHCDGDFLDSPEQALLVVPLFTTIHPSGGGTMISPSSIPIIAQYLYDHPEGVLPGGFPFRRFADECEEFVELTGDVGDVILMHPLMLHSASQNHLRTPRIITNPPVSLLSPFQFSRSDPSTYSIVELSTIHALGGKGVPLIRSAVSGSRGSTGSDGIDGNGEKKSFEGLNFEVKGERKRIVPDRLVRQAKEKAEAEERLRALSGVNGDAVA